MTQEDAWVPGFSALRSLYWQRHLSLFYWAERKKVNEDSEHLNFANV